MIRRTSKWKLAEADGGSSASALSVPVGEGDSFTHLIDRPLGEG
jgi:hypothetical protein